jgi:hypothetical protein
VNRAATARVLAFAADAMVIEVSLDPDAALRLAVWDDPDAPDPAPGAPGADVFAEAGSLLAGACHVQRDDLARVPRLDAISAARAQAAQVLSPL